MFIEAAVIGFIVAIFRKGRIKNMERLYIRGWYLFLLGGLIQGALSLLHGKNLLLSETFFNRYFVYFHLSTYLLIIIGILLNIKKDFMKFLLIGVTLNFIVIFANGGKMPVSFKNVKGYENYTEEMPDRPFDVKHTIVNENTRVVFLADIITIPKPYPLSKIISVGDIFLTIGVFLFFQESMVRKRRGNNIFS